MLKPNSLLNNTEYLLLSILCLNKPINLTFNQIKLFTGSLAESTLYLYLMILEKRKFLSRIKNSTMQDYAYRLSDSGEKAYLESNSKENRKDNYLWKNQY